MINQSVLYKSIKLSKKKKFANQSLYWWVLFFRFREIKNFFLNSRIVNDDYNGNNGYEYDDMNEKKNTGHQQ